jgi:hypothetical protein
MTGTEALPRSLEYRLHELDAGRSWRDPSLAVDVRSLALGARALGADRSEAAPACDEPRESSKRCHDSLGTLS